MSLDPGHQKPANPYQPPRADVDFGAQSTVQTNQQPAERGARLAAALIDGLLLTASAIPGGVLVGIGSAGQQRMAVIVGLGFMLMGVCILGLQIYQWVLISTTGQTLAKRWMGVRIVRVDGTPLTFATGVALRAWVPALIGAIPYVGTLFALVDVCFIFTAERRCVHDIIAGTKVIVA
jgi:uncharacterized RDD family membrane protein YckC